MARVEFQEYKADAGQHDNGVEYDESTIRVHKVTDETAGEYVTSSGPVNVRPGQVLVETYRPGVYDVLGEKQLSDLNYKPVKGTEEPVNVQATTAGEQNTESEQRTAGSNNDTERDGDSDNTSARNTPSSRSTGRTSTSGNRK